MKLFAIGDIHGCSAALDAVLDAAAPAAGDTVVTLGDYVDRGPDSRGVLDKLIALADETNLVPLLGNHDQMMLDARWDAPSHKGWLSVGGDQAVASYTDGFASIPAAHWNFLENTCRHYLETDRYIFVHGHVLPEANMADQPSRVLLWQHIAPHTEAHHSGKTVVCGHTHQDSGVPANLGHTLCLDTGAGFGGVLTAADMASGILWQADESGVVTEGRLPDPA